MRWKFLILLALLSFSLIAKANEEQTSETDVENVEQISDVEEVPEKSDEEEQSDTDYEKTDYDENNQETEVKKDEGTVVPSESENKDSEITDVVNEDVVDIEVPPSSPRNVSMKGRYYNYDDYMFGSAIDMNDQNYNWNGESSFLIFFIGF